jgi:hypothetical protein
LYWHYEAKGPKKEGPLSPLSPLSFVLFESPSTSVSTDNRAHPSLVSLAGTPNLQTSKKYISSVNILYTTISLIEVGFVQVVSSSLIMVFHIAVHFL